MPFCSLFLHTKAYHITICALPRVLFLLCLPKILHTQVSSKWVLTSKNHGYWRMGNQGFWPRRPGMAVLHTECPPPLCARNLAELLSQRFHVPLSETFFQICKRLFLAPSSPFSSLLFQLPSLLSALALEEWVPLIITPLN